MTSNAHADEKQYKKLI